MIFKNHNSIYNSSDKKGHSTIILKQESYSIYILKERKAQKEYMISITEQNNHLLIEIKGLIEYDKLIDFIDELVSTERYLTMNNIWFFEKTTVGIKFSEFWDIINFINKKHPGPKPEYNTRVALVTTTAVEKALATIWVGYSTVLPFQTANFDNLTDAHNWISVTN